MRGGWGMVPARRALLHGRHTTRRLLRSLPPPAEMGSMWSISRDAPGWGGWLQMVQVVAEARRVRRFAW